MAAASRWTTTQKEQRYNWELVFCELYAGGKYNTNGGESYEYSLGLNGLGSVRHPVLPPNIWTWRSIRDGFRYTLHFEKGENVGGLHKEPTTPEADRLPHHAGSRTCEVFTDIDMPAGVLTGTC